MVVFDRFKKFIAAVVLAAFIPSQAWAQGISIPAGATFNVNAGQLTVPGTITNAGTIGTTTGIINLDGNWTNSGTFNSGSGTVNFTATSGTQTLTSGGSAATDAFYNLIHGSAGTIQLNSSAITINNNFTNTAGTFNANSENINVGVNWENTAAFTPGTNTVTLDSGNGIDQYILGSTTFYGLSKSLAGTNSGTLFFDKSGTQTFTNNVSLQGNTTNNLLLRSTTTNTAAAITLNTGGSQSISHVDVQDSNAAGGVTLLARNSPNHLTGFNNTNWQFNTSTITWVGGTSAEWQNPVNWNIGVVPASGDTVVIPPVGGSVTHDPDLCPSGHTYSCAAVSGLASLTIQSGATLTLSGQNLSVTTGAGNFVNDGNLILEGIETVSLTQDTTDNGSFTYIGDNTGHTLTITDFGATDYHNLVIDDTNATKDIFATAATSPLNTAGTLTVTSGTLDISANTDTLTTAGTLTVNGGTLTAVNGNITAQGVVVISSGTLSAPTTAKTFDVAGNFTHSGGTFTPNTGTVTLDGTNQELIGSTTFYALNKTVAAVDTLTFDHTATQTITNTLTLQGASGQVLSLVSDSSGNAAGLTLQSGGIQVLNWLSVKDSNASGGVTLVPSNSTGISGNTNWIFSGTTVTWKGATSTAWNTAGNWDLGFVPRTQDSAVIANAANQPVLSTPVTVEALTINSGSSLTLSGQGLTVTGSFSNSGNLILEGTETLTYTQDAAHGTYTYVGVGGSSSANHTLTINGSTNVAYNNLVIDDPNSTPADRDVFAVAASHTLTINGNLTVDSGALTAAAGSVAVAVTGNVTLASPGIFTAPGASQTFTVAGNWSNSAATFNNSSGLVTFNGTNQSISGSTTFYDFSKIVSSAATLTLDHTGTQTVSHSLTLAGAASPNRLSLVSDSPTHQAGLVLLAGGLQSISDLSVTDSNAGTTPTDVTLVDRNDYQNGGNNTNWQFGNATITWKGTTSTDWNTPSNWDLGIVPVAGDTAIIANAANQPVLSTSVTTVGALTINSGSTLTLNDKNLTVSTASGGSGILTNNGTIKLNGPETVTIGTVNTNAGTVEYDGDNTGGTYNITNLWTTSSPANFVYYNLVINDTHATPDIFTVGTDTPYIYNNLTVTAGTLDLSGSTAVNVTGSVSISSGATLKAPSSTASTAFTVGGSWTNNGTFTNDNGEVNFNTSTAATIAGTSAFYDFYSHVGGKTIDFTAGTTQTVSHTFDILGATGNMIILRSTVDGTAWNLSLGSTQTVSLINVKNSDASKEVDCLDCTDAPPGGTNTNWVFETLGVDAPATGTTVGETPTMVGTAPAHDIVYIRDASSNLVATAKADANGKWRVVVGKDGASTGLTVTPSLATGANSLTPYLTSAVVDPGTVNSITVTATPAANQVPDISGLNGNAVTNPSAIQFITGSTPAIAGHGSPGQNVSAQALDANGNLIETATLGTVSAGGTYSVNWPSGTPLPSATNYLSVIVGNPTNETASSVLQVSLTDPYGYVYNSSTNSPVDGAVVTLYSATTKQAAGGTVQSCNSSGTCCDMSGNCCASGVCTSGNPPGNPFTTGTDGFYSFLAPAGQYYIGISAGGFKYPSTVSTVPSGRMVGVGSKGETFTVGSSIFELDQPLDGTNSLLRIIKTVNKTEASVGDIMTYTINIQNLSSTNAVTNVYISDEIPPGFKYINNRVQLNGTPISDPTGNRPLLFNIGTVPAATTVVLQYQLVIGSGVTMGNYQNTASARYITGLVISNPSEASVKIIPDPVFDLGSVIGKVFFDWNENGIQDAPYYDSVSHETIVEKPVPNVQIVMEDGTVITADRDGKFNIPGLLPGRHLFRLDERTLPPGAYLTTDKAVIVDVTAGMIFKVNFGVNIDQTQAAGKDAVFFNEKIKLTQDSSMPVPRLNAAIFDASANAKPGTEEVVLHDGSVVRQAEFRIFTNYWPFISNWHLDITDADTGKLVRSFEGNAMNINDPIYWDGRDEHDVIIDSSFKYNYQLTVSDNKNNMDTTKIKPITVREIMNDADFKKETDGSKDVLKDRAQRYRAWLTAQAAVNNLDHQLIPVKGETIHLDRQGTDVRSMQVLKGTKLFTDIPLSQQYGLTPQELAAGGFSTADEKDNLEVILPNGDYTLDVVSSKTPDANGPASPAAVPPSVPSGAPSKVLTPPTSGDLEHYSRPLKVGDDYVMFVALGDAQVGYNIDTGHIDPIQDKTEEPGFYKEGKGSYYLKGQVLGKYLITSSYDSDRAQKALFRSLDPNVYYPVYGDGSTVNYDAADTQGALYLKVEWDKSQVILGNYAVDFNDTQFASFSRAYYGGKISYQSLASTPYGDARTKVVVYHAQVQQLPSHNEFLATGGSLYFLKYKNVIQGSDTVTIQVRDQTTGLVLNSQTLTNGADYELDLTQGRILFWEPVAMIAQSQSIISNNLINGNPIYVVVDYQYDATQLQTTNASQGARIAQAIGDNVVLGGTYVHDNSGGQDYTLEGTDLTVHVNKDSTVKAEYAQTSSQEEGSYVSTDGGITFAPLLSGASAGTTTDTGSGTVTNTSGHAYGITGDTRLFDKVGFKAYYSWVDSGFGASADSSQQGTEKMGLSMTFDMNPETRLTASEDIQKLMANANLDATTDVGASETDTTMVQIVHQAEKLKLTGQFQLTQVKSIVDGVLSTTNTRGATIGGQAQYDLTNRIRLTAGQQVDVETPSNTATTLGVAVRATDHLTFNGQEVFSSEGRALTAGVTNQLGKRIALTTDLTLTNLNTGEVDKTASVSMTNNINDTFATTSAVSLTSSSTGATTATASVGGKAKLSANSSMDMSVGRSQSSAGGASTSLALDGNVQVDKNTSITATGQIGTTADTALGIGTTSPGDTSTSLGVQATTQNGTMSQNALVNVTNDTVNGNTTTFGFGNNARLDQELQAVTSNSFSFSPSTGSTDSTKYGVVRTTAAGQKSEADLTQSNANQPGNNITQSNIFGLSGDVNDKLALNGSIERGKIQNISDTPSQTDRVDFSLGMGYVLKDTETAEEKLKNSLKVELRVDKGTGTDSYRQYVLYDALDGKITDNWSVNGKLDYSKTMDTTTGAKSEYYEEIIMGTAYRPVNFDKLNFIAEYSYQNGYGGGLQQADALNTTGNTTIAQVFSAEGVYDINDQWQASEKIAYRILSEQDAGFQFTQTHTWLMVHRLNYKVDKDWTVSAELRDLGVVEAHDNNAGLLVQASRDINANTQLTIGWNFTKYTDDLTDLSYTSTGPFVRMDGKFYDETPQERARAKAKWLDDRINEWAWVLIKNELAKKDSKIVLELNRMFAIARAAQRAGRLQEAKQIYKDIITAGQIMYNEAAVYIRGRIDFEDQMQKLDKTAREYFKGGEYVKARKIWEKVVEDASKGMVK